MLIAFAVVQVGFNVALLILMARLLRERAAQARQVRDREERLEALAVELCAVAREFTRQEMPAASVSPPAPTVVRPGASEESRDVPPRPAEPSYPCPDLGERVRGAAALLAQGLAVERVAAETSLLPGEVQVLRNLRSVPPSEHAAIEPVHGPALKRAHRVARRANA